MFPYLYASLSLVTLMIVHCSGTSSCSGEAVLNVSTARKCCPDGYPYDMITHVCVRPASTAGEESSSLANIGLSACNPGVIIDYKVSEMDDIKFINDSLFLRHQNRTLLSGDYCIGDIKINGQNGFVVRGCYKNSDVCLAPGMQCLRKCCGDMMQFVEQADCKPTTKVVNYTSFNQFQISDNFSILHGTTCSKYVGSDMTYTVEANGSLILTEKEGNLTENVTYSPTTEMYCIEHLDIEKESSDEIFFCFKQLDTYDLRFNTIRILLIISCIFIKFTMIAYFLIFETFNLFAKTLVTYCLNLLVLFSFLVYLQFDNTLRGPVCVTIGYIIMTLGLSAFTWMNTMSFDIWWTFGTQKGSLTVQQKLIERKRFLFYSLYAWGVPLVLTGQAIAAQFSGLVPEYVNPQVGDEKCFFSNNMAKNGNYSKLIFYLIPIGIFKATDVIFFIKTSIYCVQVKSTINKMNDTNSVNKRKSLIRDKERLELLVKLFLVMGISWVFEVISGAVDFGDSEVLKTVENVIDGINCLQGVFIFIIFVCKRNVIDSFRRKIPFRVLRRTSMSSAAVQSTLATKTYQRPYI